MASGSGAGSLSLSPPHITSGAGAGSLSLSPPHAKTAPVAKIIIKIENSANFFMVLSFQTVAKKSYLSSFTVHTQGVQDLFEKKDVFQCR
jgi:hypothetical protein